MTTAATETLAMRRDQVPEAGIVLSRAFWDDPMIEYVIPDEKTRKTGLPWFMTLAAKYGAKHGEPFTTASKVEGAALWLPPGETKVSTMQMIQAGLLKAPFKLGLGATMRFNKLMTLMDHLHEEAMPDRHWYLMVLGVDPPRQGQGVGGALIAPIIARADADALPCYLETMKTKNVTFYQKHGFEVVVEDDIQDGPHYWTMKRMPR